MMGEEVTESGRKTQLGEMKCDHASGKNGDGDTCRRGENTMERNQIGTW